MCFVHFHLEMCFAPQRRALFRHRNFQKWSEPGVFCTFSLGNVLRTTTACTFSSLIWPAGSAPAALASLLFDPPEPQIIGKHSESRLSYLFAHLHLLSSDLFSSDSSHLCFSTVHIVGSFTSKLPSKRDMTFRNCSTFWYQPPTSVDAIMWACCGILPNQDLLQVASAEDESEKGTRLWAGQDPNWHFVAISSWPCLSGVLRRHAKTIYDIIVNQAAGSCSATTASLLNSFPSVLGGNSHLVRRLRGLMSLIIRTEMVLPRPSPQSIQHFSGLNLENDTGTGTAQDWVRG